MIATQLVTVESSPCGYIAYARKGPREHQVKSTSADLAARLAAAGLHQRCLVDVKSVAHIGARVWQVYFRHGALVQEAAR